MKIKCVSSNIGTISIPGHGLMTFGGNCLYVVPDDVGAYLRGYDPKNFKYIDNSQPKGSILPNVEPENKSSYTEKIKSTLGFTNTAVSETEVETKDLED